MRTIVKVEIPENFWPSGRGRVVATLAANIFDVAETLNLPVFLEEDIYFLVLEFEETGVMTLYYEKNYWHPDVQTAKDLSICLDQKIYDDLESWKPVILRLFSPFGEIAFGIKIDHVPKGGS